MKTHDDKTLIHGDEEQPPPKPRGVHVSLPNAHPMNAKITVGGDELTVMALDIHVDAHEPVSLKLEAYSDGVEALVPFENVTVVKHPNFGVAEHLAWSVLEYAETSVYHTQERKERLDKIVAFIKENRLAFGRGERVPQPEREARHDTMYGTTMAGSIPFEPSSREDYDALLDVTVTNDLTPQQVESNREIAHRRRVEGLLQQILDELIAQRPQPLEAAMTGETEVDDALDRSGDEILRLRTELDEIATNANEFLDATCGLPIEENDLRSHLAVLAKTLRKHGWR